MTADYTPLDDLERTAPPPEEEATPDNMASTDGPVDQGVASIRPWIRFVARGLDINLWIFLIGTLYSALQSSLPDVSWVVASLVALLFYNFVEATSFALYGTTPGKWLLRVYVRTATGERLRFGRALKRAFGVYVKGLALGIPILNLVAMAAAYSRLTDNGETDWDREGRFTVSHGRVGVVRSILTALMVLGLLALAVVGYLNQDSVAAVTS